MTIRSSNFESTVEQIEQELGLGPTSQQREEALLKFRDLPFWIWDEREHERIYRKTYGERVKDQPHCCFNHVLGLPVKLGLTHPLYTSYQKPVVEALSRYRRIAVVKSRSSGLTELMLRWAEHIALRDMSLRGHEIIIISAPGEHLSLSFIRRIKTHLEPHLGIFNSNQNELIVNDCTIRAYPSHNLRTLRGRSDVAMCLIEESDMWDKSEEDELLPVVLPYIQKSNPFIAMVSTPGRKGSLMERMFTADLQTNEEEARQYSMFHKINVRFEDVQLYSDEERRLALMQPNAAREFLGQWGFGTGTLYSYTDLQYAVELGRRYADVRYNPDHAKRPYPYCIYPEATATMIGVDTAGGSGSQFAIVGLQIWGKHVHVFAAEAHSRANFDNMIDRVMELWEGTSRRGIIYVDSSNPGWIRLMKQRISQVGGGGGRNGVGVERVDFENYIEYLRQKGRAGDNDASLSDWMSVVPVRFASHAPRLLQTLAVYIQRHMVSIHPDFRDLIGELHSARTREHATHDWQLDKSQNSNDLLDAFRCCFYDSIIPPTSERPKIAVTAY